MQTRVSGERSARRIPLKAETLEAARGEMADLKKQKRIEGLPKLPELEGEGQTTMKHIVVKLLALIALACSLATMARAESFAKRIDIGGGRMMYIECHGSGSRRSYSTRATEGAVIPGTSRISRRRSQRRCSPACSNSPACAATTVPAHWWDRHQRISVGAIPCRCPEMRRPRYLISMSCLARRRSRGRTCSSATRSAGLPSYSTR